MLWTIIKKEIRDYVISERFVPVCILGGVTISASLFRPSQRR